MGEHGLVVYYANHHCSHSTAISGDAWPDEVRLSDVKDDEQFVSNCQHNGYGSRRSRGRQVAETYAF